MMRRTTHAFGRTDRILIVGAGPAGSAAVEQLRCDGFAGTITVLCDEPDAPYDRPACSKALLTGHQTPDDVRLDVDAEAVDWRYGRRAVGLDPVTQAVTAQTGEVFHYDGLVIATGARAVLPPNFPKAADGLHVLHNVDQAWALRRDLRDARRVAIVGGGLTGCEVACSIRSLAREAVIIDSKRALMHRAIGEPVGAMLTGLYRAEGVDLRLGVRVSELDRRRGRWRLLLSDGSYEYADLVVVTAGERPDTDWLADSGIDVSDGVLCDASLRVVGVDNAVAAGGLARWPNLRYSAEPGRVGQWIAAMEQGRGAARTLLSAGRLAAPVTLLPRFWSQQFGLRIQVAGRTDPSARVCVTHLRPGRRDVARAGVLASYHAHDELVGLVAVNAPHAFTSTARVLLAGVPVEATLPAVAVASPHLAAVG